jgi:hypothetical protein
MLAWRPLSALALLSGLTACGSDPASKPKSDSPSEIPDYTQSPCYGNRRSTLVYDAVTHVPSEVSATCRAEGERTLLYVADAVWETPRSPGAPAIDQSEVDAFMFGYELDGRRTSYAPDLGVLPTDELVFGPLNPDTLPDGKLPVFIVDSGGLGEGYICSWCTELELHLDGPLLRSLHTDEALSIAAHETFHAIHRGHDANETIWVDETLAEAAMTVNGFYTDEKWVEDFLGDTNVAWGPGVDDPLTYNYGAGLLFGTYLWERGGRGLLRAITSEELDDWSGLDAALATTRDASDAWSVYLDMALATFLDDPSTGYWFESFDLGGGVLPYVAETGATLSDTIQRSGLVFVVFDADARSVTLDTGANVSSRLVLAGRPTEVRELSLGEPMDFDATPRVLLLSAQQTAAFSLSVR